MAQHHRTPHADPKAPRIRPATADQERRLEAAGFYDKTTRLANAIAPTPNCRWRSGHGRTVIVVVLVVCVMLSLGGVALALIFGIH